MAELVRATVRCVDLGSVERMAHDRADPVRAFHQSADWRHGPQEEVPVRAGGPSMLEIGGDRRTYIGGQWQQALPPAFATHPQLSAVPVDVVQCQPDDLASA